MNSEEKQKLLGAEENLTSRLLHRLDKTIYRMQTEALSSFNISQTQSLIIIYLGFHDGESVYQYMLEKHFGLTNPTVTASIKSLINKNLLYREKDPNDGRYYKLCLTDDGKRLIDPCIQIILDINERFSSRLTNEENKQLLYLIKKMLT